MIGMWTAVAVAVVLIVGGSAEGRPHRILVDTDVDTDDLFALLYLIKLNTSQFKLEVSLHFFFFFFFSSSSIIHLFLLPYQIIQDFLTTLFITSF